MTIFSYHFHMQWIHIYIIIFFVYKYLKDLDLGVYEPRLLSQLVTLNLGVIKLRSLVIASLRSMNGILAPSFFSTGISISQFFFQWHKIGVLYIHGGRNRSFKPSWLDTRDKTAISNQHDWIRGANGGFLTNRTSNGGRNARFSENFRGEFHIWWERVLTWEGYLVLKYYFVNK